MHCQPRMNAVKLDNSPESEEIHVATRPDKVIQKILEFRSALQQDMKNHFYLCSEIQTFIVLWEIFLRRVFMHPNTQIRDKLNYGRFFVIFFWRDI